MYKPLSLAVAAVALALPATASAAWSPPTQLSGAEESNPIAQAAFGGSVLTGWLEPTAAVSKQLGAPRAITAADPYETVWQGGLDKDGNAVVVTVRKHKPVQRVRAIFVSADGAKTPARTISQAGHSASGPVMDVAPDGTAAAVWAWHDPAGWRVQAAIRRPGQASFDPPQTLSGPGPVSGRYQSRPFTRIAAGTGGRAAISWQFGGSGDFPEAPLQVATAGTDAKFGAAQALGPALGYADADLAVSPAGTVEVAWLDEHFTNHGPNPALRAASGAAGAPLGEPATLSTGGKGTSSGTQVATAFAADGTPIVAWAKPGDKYEDGGTLEVFRNGAEQALAEHAEGLQLDGDALAWMTHATGKWTVHASVAGSPDTVISDPAHNALWPSIALTPTGAIAAWVTNDNGGGSGRPTAAMFAR